MKILSTLFAVIILLNFSACNGSEPEVILTAIEPEISERYEILEAEPENATDIWTPFTEDSDGRMVFADPWFFEPLGLLGYIVTEDGDVFIPTDDWEECDSEFFRERVFGTWFSMYDSDSPIIIDEIYPIEEIYRNSDDTIIYITYSETDFDDRFIHWLCVSEPDVIYSYSIDGFTYNGWDISINIYKDYIASPVLHRSYRGD